MRLQGLTALAVQLARTPLGRRYLSLIHRHCVDNQGRVNDKQLLLMCMDSLGKYYNRTATLKGTAAVSKIDGFEDLAWLFASSPLNHGVIAMAFDEAAYLYRLARSLKSASCLEIGRFKGGSTFLLAAALDERSRLVSVDNHTKLTGVYDYRTLDADLRATLCAYGLDSKVELVVGDSSRLSLEPESLDLAFLDGDHSYEAVKADYQVVREAIKPGGHIVFHDAFGGAIGAGAELGVSRLVEEIMCADEGYIAWRGSAGSLVHFCRCITSTTLNGKLNG